MMGITQFDGKRGDGHVQRFVHSKWRKTEAIKVNPVVREHIPDTRQLGRATLQSMLSEYGMVYVKPDKGTFGKGVIRVEQDGAGFKFQSGTTIRTFASYEGLYDGLKQLTGKRLYLVQKGIHLLKHGGRRFDLRVMVQKSPAGRWESTAMVGRVAYPGKIVTNYHSGGTLKSVPALLQAHMGPVELTAFTGGLKRLGVSVAKQLETAYPGIKEIGIDIAVDRSHKSWILEVNTCPDPYIFRILKDKEIFRRVIRYAKAYGRIKSR